MFQLAVILTFDDTTTQATLEAVLDSYSILGSQLRRLQPAELLLTSLGWPPDDSNARMRALKYSRIRDYLGDEDDAETRALDILALAKRERETKEQPW